MRRLREEFDSDLDHGVAPTDYRSSKNRFEIPCSVCGESLYVDEETQRDFDRAIEHDLDNTFRCYRCEEEYDTLAYE